MRFALTAVLSAALATAAPAQAPASGSEVFIHAGALLDRPGEEPRGNATLVVRDGRIVSVQDGFSQPPPGATLIALSDRFVLPGPIDSHVHLSSDRAGQEELGSSTWWGEGVRSW